jgi:hypothetical protein
MAMAAFFFFIILSPFGFLSLVFYSITLIGKTKPPVPVSQRKDFFLVSGYYWDLDAKNNLIQMTACVNGSPRNDARHIPEISVFMGKRGICLSSKRPALGLSRISRE